MPWDELRSVVHVCGLVDLILLEPPADSAWNRVGSGPREEPVVQLDQRISKQCTLCRINRCDIAPDAISQGHGYVLSVERGARGRSSGSADSPGVPFVQAIRPLVGVSCRRKGTDRSVPSTGLRYSRRDGAPWGMTLMPGVFAATPPSVRRDFQGTVTT